MTVVDRTFQVSECSGAGIAGSGSVLLLLQKLLRAPCLFGLFG